MYKLIACGFLAFIGLMPIATQHANAIKVVQQNDLDTDEAQERRRIWNEIHFCIKKMHLCLDKADREASKITAIDVEQATRAAIQGAICGLTTRSTFGVVITGCLNSLGQIAGDSYSHWRKACQYVGEAAYYAERADELQEQLWNLS